MTKCHAPLIEQYYHVVTLLTLYQSVSPVLVLYGLQKKLHLQLTEVIMLAYQDLSSSFHSEHTTCSPHMRIIPNHSQNQAAVGIKDIYSDLKGRIKCLTPGKVKQKDW